MIVIVNTTSDERITDTIRKHLNAARVTADIVEAGDLNIGHCIGCNHCWLKTPGECAVKDDYEEILKKIIHADQLWVISDTALGFINHKGKNIFDRVIPIITMNLFFKKKEMRHVKRYKKNANVGLIFKGEADGDFLNRWMERVALNLGSKSLGAFKESEVKEALSCMC